MEHQSKQWMYRMWICLAVGIRTNQRLLMLRARCCVPSPQFTLSVSEQSTCSHQPYGHWQLVHMRSATSLLWRFKSDMFAVQNGYTCLFNVFPCLVLYHNVLLWHGVLWALKVRSTENRAVLQDTANVLVTQHSLVVLFPGDSYSDAHTCWCVCQM